MELDLPCELRIFSVFYLANSKESWQEREMLHIAASIAKIFRSTISSQDMQVLFVSPLLRMGWVEGSVLEPLVCISVGLLVCIVQHDLVSVLSLLSLGKENAIAVLRNCLRRDKASQSGLDILGNVSRRGNMELLCLG